MKMGSRRFELLTSAMSRRRHSQLDHEPSKMGKCFFNLDHPNIKKLAFIARLILVIAHTQNIPWQGNFPERSIGLLVVQKK